MDDGARASLVAPELGKNRASIVGKEPQNSGAREGLGRGELRLWDEERMAIPVLPFIRLGHGRRGRSCVGVAVATNKCELQQRNGSFDGRYECSGGSGALLLLNAQGNDEKTEALKSFHGR